MNYDQKTTATESSNGGKSFFSSTKNKLLVAAAIVVILFASLWIWKAVEIKNLKQENEKKESLLR